MLFAGIVASQAGNNEYTREYADRLISWMKTDPPEMQDEIVKLNAIVYTVPKETLSDWDKRIHFIPFSFALMHGTYSCRFRQIRGVDLLLVAECNMSHTLYDKLYAFPFFITRNAMSGNYEFRSLPPRSPEEADIASRFAFRFIEALLKMPTDNLPQPPNEEKRKSWKDWFSWF